MIINSPIFKTTEDGSLTNIFKQICSAQVSLDNLDKSTIRSVINSFNKTALSVDELSQKLGRLNSHTVEYLRSAERGNASINGFSKSIDTVATSMISATTKANLLAIALNAITGVAITLSLKSIVLILDKLITTFDEQKEKLEQTVAAYKDSKTELESINEELKTTSERIDELNEKNNLTFTEQNELDKLIKANDELERKIYLLEQANKEAEKKVTDEAQNTYDKFTNDRNIDAVEQINFYSNSPLLEGVDWNNYKDDLSWLVAQYKNQQVILNNAQQEGWTSIEEQSKKNIELLEGYMSDASLNYQNLYDTISNISEVSMTPELETAKSDLNDILDIIAEILGYDGQGAEKSFDDIWNSEDFKKEKEDLLSIASNGEITADILTSNEKYNQLLIDTGKNAEETAEHINALAESKKNEGGKKLNAPPTLSSTLDQLNTQMKPAFDSIKSAYQNIFTDDGFTLEHVDLNMLDGLKSTFDDLNKIEGISIDYSSFEDLSKVLLDSSSSADDVGKAFNAMAADVINSLNPSLSQCSAENYKLIQSMLESLGIQNSEQVMIGALGYSYEDYLAAKAECVNAGFNLADATQEEINKFIEEQGGIENCGNALALFQLKKLLVANTGINQSSDIQQILGLASAAGLSTSALSRLAEAKSMLDTAVKNGDTRGIHEAKKYASELEEEIKDDLNGFQLPTIDYKTPAKGCTSNKGNSGSKDTHKETYEKELSSLEYLHKMSLISDKDYYNQLNTINETYFNDTAEHHEKYLDEYQANEEKVAQGLKDVWTKYWEDYKSDLDKVSSYAERVLSKQIDSLKNQQEQEVDGKELEIDAIDDKISALNKEKDATEKLYQDQIDVIQDQIDSYNDEIDKLREINEEKNRQLKLEQDLYELERLRNQKTQKEYVDGKGTVYKTDSSAIRDQEQQVENDRLDIEIAGYENLIKGLESQQDSLKDKMDSVITSIEEQIAKLDEQKDGIQEKIDTINLGYEAQIEALERYKEKWTEVSDYQAILDEETLARQLLGVDAEQNILDMREGILNDYISKYQLASENLTLLSDAKLFEMNDILAQMQAASDLVDTTKVKENLATTGTVADTTREQISNVTSKFNDLANEVSTFTLPPINTEQFIASLGTAEGSTGILGQLQTFTDRFREICDLIPTSWKNALDSILGSGPTDGKGTDYNILFIPLLSAMDNCKSQMDIKLAEYATAWIDFNTKLGAIIGIDGGDSDPNETPNDGAKSTNGNKKEENPNSANSIISTIRTGGTLINAEFNDTWIPGFQSMGERVNDICSKIVSCVNQMAEKTVNACRTAIDAINKANAAKESSGSKNSKPPIFHGASYEDVVFADSKLALKPNVNSSLAGELGAKLVFNGKTNQFRYVSRNGAEFANSTYIIPEGYTQVNRTNHLMALQSNPNSAALPQDIDITKFLDLPVTAQNRNHPIQLDSPLNHLNSLIMKDIIPTPVTQKINLTLPNVTNESGAQYIIKTLKGLPSDTIQYTHRN